MKRRSHHDEQASGWVATAARRWQRCSDCDLRGALHADGHVLRHPKLLFRLSVGCEACGGSGLMPAHDVLDDYSTGKS